VRREDGEYKLNKNVRRSEENIIKNKRRFRKTEAEDDDEEKRKEEMKDKKENKREKVRNLRGFKEHCFYVISSLVVLEKTSHYLTLDSFPLTRV
jgi:uncharacterized protein (UPF0305 family)